MGYHIGIDAGSKTVKLIILDEEYNVVFSSYKRHLSNIYETLQALVHDACWRFGDVEGTLAVTGSAGISVANILGVPFVQEVIATTKAVRHDCPDADAFLELGGEDAKVVYLNDPLEQRMNATCAGGTGGFIDAIAYTMGVRASDMGSMALSSTNTYAIASRCAVFAQTDVRPLLNAGVNKNDIARSVLDAVVRQTMGGLACGRPIRGKVVFLGGPIEHIPYLTMKFKESLDLTKENAVKPKNAHLYTVKGAALEGAKTADATVSLSQIEIKIKERSDTRYDGDLDKLPPLFSSEEEKADFDKRHAGFDYPKASSFDARGPLYLGIDAGSTAIKLALIDRKGNLLHYAYEASRGDLLSTAVEMVRAVYAAIPDEKACNGKDVPFISRVCVTGYGEDLLKSALNADCGVVETSAHLRAAKQLCPDVSFVLDIGGQDMKAMWVDNGFVSDSELNEACSSGCGAFIDGTAYSLNESLEKFSELALESRAPLDLGMRCTVFMSSRVKHAQKMGVDVKDIAAGVAYSVVKNAMFRIIGERRAASIGDKVVVQGGAFKSDAVLRAFELLSGTEVIRSDQAHLMGAIGAALIAKDRADGCESMDSSRTRTDGSADSKRLESSSCECQRSGMLSYEQLLDLSVDRESVVCRKCGNSCKLTVLDFSDGRRFVFGNKCERGSYIDTNEEAAFKKNSYADDVAPDGLRKTVRFQNVVEYEQDLLSKYIDCEADRENMGLSASHKDFEPSVPKSADVGIGIVNTLETFEQLPFWHTFFRKLGFKVLIADDVGDQLADRACETILSESVCFPAKITHRKVMSLLDKNASAVFMPEATSKDRCPVAAGYSVAIKDGFEELRSGDIEFISPRLVGARTLEMFGCEGVQDFDENIEVLRKCSEDFFSRFGLDFSEEGFKEALDAAVVQQREFEDAVCARTHKVLRWLEKDKSRHGIVLAGRPYHMDETVIHSIDDMLTDMGFAVFSTLGFREQIEAWRGSEAAGCVHPWKPAQDYLAISRIVGESDQLDVVFLESFGCGFDAVSLEDAKSYIKSVGRPFTALKIDEMVDVSHIRIRLRTLAETLSQVSRKKPDTEDGIRKIDGSSVRGMAGLPGKETGSKMPGLQKCDGRFASVSTDVFEADEDLLSEEDRCGVSKEVYLFEEPLNNADLEFSRKYISGDICFTIRMLAARAARLLKEDPTIDRILLPKVCVGCLNDALVHIVKQTCGIEPEFSFVEDVGFSEDDAGICEDSNVDSTDCEKEGYLPKIGLLGNPLMCFDPFMNDGIEDMLARLGAIAVFPDPELICTDDISYVEQLENYSDAGIKDVIYLQSFGCLKGHVQARGQLHKLSSKFPDIKITVIDYDSESSALNRENRVRLAVEVARESSELNEATKPNGPNEVA